MHDPKVIEEYLTNCSKEKAQWGKGPWATEPDRIEWTSHGYACLMNRNSSLGNWCGYVGVPLDHPWVSGPRDDIEVHGGVTYEGRCGGVICHAGEEDRFWFGFDCGHAWDLMPGLTSLFAQTIQRDQVYRDAEYVKGEIENLVQQAIAAEHR